MSAIEEAREQAREALELAHTWRQREQAWDTPRALGFEKIGQAIRTLLDATEPSVIQYAESATVAALAEQGETGWEYGNEQLLHSHVEVFPASSEAVARAQAWLYPILRRRKAGPWLPVPGSTVRESDSGVRDSDSEESEGE